MKTMTWDHFTSLVRQQRATQLRAERELGSIQRALDSGSPHPRALAYRASRARAAAEAIELRLDTLAFFNE